MTLTISQRNTDKTWEVLPEGTRLLLLRLPQSDQLCVMLNKVFERVIRDRLLQLRVDRVCIIVCGNSIRDKISVIKSV